MNSSSRAGTWRLAEGGRIINISSGLARFSLPGWPAG
ncbi:SDR family oxidoreductase [Herbaspirillum rubrisubalbicans]|nr:SDR family oxidoreductase [Herbaspirillum rubrisubalbicans]